MARQRGLGLWCGNLTRFVVRSDEPVRCEESNLTGIPKSTVPVLKDSNLRAFTRSAAPRPGHRDCCHGCYILRSNPRGYPDLFKNLTNPGTVRSNADTCQ